MKLDLGPLGGHQEFERNKGRGGWLEAAEALLRLTEGAAVVLSDATGSSCKALAHVCISFARWGGLGQEKNVCGGVGVWDAKKFDVFVLCSLFVWYAGGAPL